MSEIHDMKLNELLESIDQRPFHQRTIQKLMCLISEARLLPASTYITPSMEVFNKDHINGDDTDPNIVEENEELHEVLLCSALDMEKLFPIRWTKEVYNKFANIGIHTPQQLFHHITHGTLNPLLSQHKHMTMNHSTMKILADATPQFRTEQSHQFGYNQG